MAPLARADDASTTPDSIVTTGDATASSDTDNEVNQNTTQGSSVVTNTNSALLGNDTSTNAATGDNSAQSTGGSVSVSSGSALSSANVINVVNTNITNSTGLLQFINAFFAGGYDLRNLDLSYFDSAPSGDPSCSLSSCSASSTSLKVTNINNATLINTVISTASTGGNTASSTGDASVTTGDAAASANVVNVVNTNITNSHYLLVALNNFGDLGGDVTLPDAGFFNQLMAQQKAAHNSTANNNIADVVSNTSAVADTGGNTASSTGDATITTGNALASATTVNQVNTNLTGGSTVYMLVNVFGTWSGTIQGLPAGLTWTQTPNGVAIMGNTGALAGADSSTTPASVDVSNQNDATVNNNVQVYALTGQNFVSSDTGTSTVSTGNAYASANVVNLVNTNVLGQNWVLAIMNVFGNWSGNLSFGHPDLWIGGVAQTGNPAAPGSPVTYTFTVANRGDADATGVVLNAAFDPSMLDFGAADSDAGASWNLGDIPAGQTEQFSYTATVGTPPGDGALALPLTATVGENEDDNNIADNTEVVTITVGDWLTQLGGASIGPYTLPPKLTITKTQSLDTATVPTTVDYKVVVDNADDAGPAYDAWLDENLTDPSGNAVYKNSWELDTMEPGDEVTLTYSVDYSATSTLGLYTDTSEVTGLQNYSQLPYASYIEPIFATTTLALSAPQAAAVLPPIASECPGLITSYLSPGSSDPAQVKLLQYFLDTFAGAHIPQDGIYGPATTAAVKAFQAAHAADILGPWGMSAPSGSVYYTTQQEINNLYCQGRATFALSNTQESEILAYADAHAGAPVFAGEPTTRTLASEPHKPSSPVVVGAPSQTHQAGSIWDSVLGQISYLFSTPFAHAEGN